MKNDAKTAAEAIRLAKENEFRADMRSSAELCRRDAEKALSVGEFDTAIMFAARSLRYSVGVFSYAFQHVASQASERNRV